MCALNVSSRRSLLKTVGVKALIVASGLGMAVIAGKMVASGAGLMAFMLAFSLLAFILVLHPINGLYAFYPTAELSFRSLVLHFPLFDSPLNALVMLTAGIGIARVAVRHRRLPISPLYMPLLACLIILATAAVVGHGSDAGFRLYRFALGLVPLVLTVLLVETGHQAKRVLVMALGTQVAFAGFWLGPMIAYYQANSVFGASASLLRAAYNPEYYLTGGFAMLVPILSGGPTATWQVMMVLPILLSLAFSASSRRLRGFCTVASALCTIYIVLGLFAISLAGVIIAILATLYLTWRYSPTTLPHPYRVIILCAGFAALIFLTPQGQITTDRILWAADPGTVGLPDSRWQLYLRGVQLFLDNPVFGIGAYFWAGPQGHSFFIESAYQFGAFYLLALVSAMALVGRSYVRLLSYPLTRDSRALVIGMLATFVTSMAMSLVNPFLGNVSTDWLFWLYAGLAVVWLDWLQREPATALVA